MSNRLLALFMVVALFGGLIGAYYYFFVLNKGDLSIHVNVDEYAVEMYNHTLKTTSSTFCEHSTCEIIDLAPFVYTLTIKKDGYKDISQNVTILARDLVEVTVTLEKQLQVILQEPEEKFVLNREPTEREETEAQIKTDAYKVFEIEGK